MQSMTKAADCDVETLNTAKAKISTIKFGLLTPKLTEKSLTD